eukprot:gene7666-10430_t
MHRLLYRSTVPIRGNSIRLNKNRKLLSSLFSPSTNVTPTQSLAKPEEIIELCLKIRTSVQSLNDKFKGPLEKSSQKNTILPFVFLLGNHSSGKSSFINYVCDKKIQTAGVAPTDDAFSIIVPGPNDVDRDGPSFIGDPDMGFSGLRTFGPQLIHHTQLKIRANTAIDNFMIVDTPGMIDSPMVRDHTGINKHAVMDRGYDFEGVCRWYTERADVILLFFDPDKPGTTGETLSILTSCLVGLEHKLHIILNKADQFRKMHDFARAYGALCWNLSKVIHRKDLPRIYAMCLPKAYQSHSGDGFNNDVGMSGIGLKDLEDSREEVVREVLNAPKRRVDNEITRLSDSVSILQMHLKIVDDLSRQYRNAALTMKLSTLGILSVTSIVTGGLFTLQMPIELLGGTVLFGSISSGVVYYYQSNSLTKFANLLITSDNMLATFKKLYSRRISEKDEFTMSLWARVHDHLIVGLTATELISLDRVSNNDLKTLEKIIDQEIPDLRRKSAPTFNKII